MSELETSRSDTCQDNPFVGPGPLTADHMVYGRDRELAELTNLLIARRLMLLHAPSGAGKTSLIQAGLIRALQDRDFQVLPLIRIVQHAPTLDDGRKNYRLGLLHALEASVPTEGRVPEQCLNDLILTDYFCQRFSTLAETSPEPALAEGSAFETDNALADEAAKPLFVLIFDQFEEIISNDPADDAGRHAFFRELGKALREPNVWALFSMREDYLASLQPYRHYLPTALSTVYRLELLDPSSAVEALEGPAYNVGIPFDQDASRALVENLRALSARERNKKLPGPYVEPIFLQIVGYMLWRRLPAGTAEITEKLVRDLVDVDQVLGDYYDESISAVTESARPRESRSLPSRWDRWRAKFIQFLQTEEANDPEWTLRQWIERFLIARTGTDGRLVRQWAVEGAGGLSADNREHVERLVNDRHLLRREESSLVVRYELLHDRLLEPINLANRYAQVRQQFLIPRLLVWLQVACLLVCLALGLSLASMLWQAASTIGHELTKHPVRTSY